MNSAWPGIVLVLVALSTSMFCLSKVGCDRDPEQVRKALHVMMGLVSLYLPLIFADRWPVLLLAGLIISFFIVLRAHGPLRRSLGSALHRVPRSSFGEIYFVIGTTLVFFLSEGNALLYCTPMLILCFADAAAAMVGTRWGRHRIVIGSTKKTLEGSLTFFVVAFCCAWLPLTFFGALSASQCAVGALATALATTLLEAFGGRGLDNLLVPLGAFVVLTSVSEPLIPATVIWIVIIAGTMLIATILARGLPFVIRS